jgi:lipopolysaccharide transport protein LptA
MTRFTPGCLTAIALILIIFFTATPCLASEAGRVLVGTFASDSIELAGAGAGFESRLVERLNTAASNRASFQLAPSVATVGELEARDIRDLAASEGASYVVVGTWLTETSVSHARAKVELRSGHSGATARRYEVDIAADGASLDAEVSRVALLVLRDLENAPTQIMLPAISAGGPSEQNVRESIPAGKRGDFLSMNRDEPVEITSEEFELIAEGDTKYLVFTKTVSVIQGEMHLYAEKIEAVYPNGASQPERLDASQSVRLYEGNVEVHCREATYLRNEEIVICRGDALLIQGCDEVRGDEIEFLLGEERVKVKGAASIVLRFDLEDAASCDDKAVTG